jgi:hypothetical protein
LRWQGSTRYFLKVFKPIKTSISKGYYTEIDDSPLCNE